MKTLKKMMIPIDTLTSFVLVQIELQIKNKKMIARKNIPAIAKTIAAIIRLVSLQLYTLFKTNKIEYMRNYFM